VTDSGDNAPQPNPAAGPPPIPPRPPAPGSAQPQYPMPPEYATLPYPAPPYAPASYAQPGQAPHTYAPPPGYAPPPQGYGPYIPSPAPAPGAGRSGLGIVAFALALLAALGASIVGSIAGFNIGLGTGREVSLQPMDIDFDWSILTPVREWVLLGELSFWAGTILGIWAIVQGIVAIVRNRGRGWGIAAIVVAAIGPIAFATGVQAFLAAGFASGASLGG
jgi:hypothetical protein